MSVKERIENVTFPQESVEGRIRDVAFLYHVKKTIISCLKLHENKYYEIFKETNLVNDLGSDSLDQMEIMMALEELFALDEIPEEEARKSTTIGHIFEYLKKHSAKKIEDVVMFEDEKFDKMKFLSDIEKMFEIVIGDKNAINSINDLIESVVANA